MANVISIQVCMSIEMIMIVWVPMVMVMPIEVVTVVWMSVIIF